MLGVGFETAGQGSGLVSISLDALPEERELLRAKFALTTAAVARAEVRAVNKTARWLRTHILRQVARETGIPQKALKRRFRVPITAKRARAGRAVAKFWAGLLGVDPMSLGKTGRRTRAGYRVGRHLFAGAFRAYFSSRYAGRGGIYKRTGPRRGPLVRQYIPIDSETETAIQRVLPRANRELFKRLKQEINFEMHKQAELL